MASSLLAIILTVLSGVAHAADLPTAQDVYERLVSTKDASILEAEFRAASAPTSIPNGYAVGEHLFLGVSKAKVPRQLALVTNIAWHGKHFDSVSRELTDHLTRARLPATRAALSIEPLRDILAQRYLGILSDDGTWGDGKASLITDYGLIDYGRWQGPLFDDATGWLDEFREVAPGVWLGRSFYDGLFWCYVVLRFVP